MEIFWSKKLHLPNELAFQKFVQEQANRLMQGFCRYGGPDRSQRYLTRMKKELKAYEKTGNAEHLINLANYCHLEDFAPENPKYHFDNTIGSVTRGKV
jgi:hypothetical protein